MNNAEYIRMTVRNMVDQNKLTPNELVEIIEDILEPYPGNDNEPGHLQYVGAKLQRMERAK